MKVTKTEIRFKTGF